MATAAQTAERFPERVVTPESLVALLGTEKIRRLHAAIAAALGKGQALTVRVQPREPGRLPKVTVAPEIEVV